MSRPRGHFCKQSPLVGEDGRPVSSCLSGKGVEPVCVWGVRAQPQEVRDLFNQGRGEQHQGAMTFARIIALSGRTVSVQLTNRPGTPYSMLAVSIQNRQPVCVCVGSRQGLKSPKAKGFRFGMVSVGKLYK